MYGTSTLIFFVNLISLLITVIHWGICALIGLYAEEIGKKFGIKKEFPALLLAVTISGLIGFFIFAPIQVLLKH